MNAIISLQAPIVANQSLLDKKTGLYHFDTAPLYGRQGKSWRFFHHSKCMYDKFRFSEKASYFA
jgi:hypothetical protein